VLSRLAFPKKVRPMRRSMHICEVVYTDRLNRLKVENSIPERCYTVHCFVADKARTKTVDAPLTLIYRRW